jgi:organic hydroperoxide reductase OsmC/OhrA
MSVIKAFRYPASVELLPGDRVRVAAPDKPKLEVATPPEFRGGVAGVWSPEELIVGATAACYALTLMAVAAARRIPLRVVEAEGSGHVERHQHGPYEFTVIEVDARIETEPGFEEAAQAAAALAEEQCVVSRALETPVHVRLTVDTTTEEGVMAP